MNRKINLGRTARPRVNVYAVDGLGRDGYISFNNGGFWTRNIKEIKYTPNYHQYRNENYRVLGHSTAPFKYHSDGSGRDTYILTDSGGLKRNYVPLKMYQLDTFLRTQDDSTRSRLKHFASQKEINVHKYIRGIEKGLIGRLYTKSIEKKKEMEKVMLTEGMNRERFIPYLRVYRNNSESKCLVKKGINAYKNDNPKPVLPVPKYKRRIMLSPIDTKGEY